MDTSPLAGHAAGTSQDAAVHGRTNVIVQIQGDGNTVVPGFPHLTLTRYTNRRHQAPTEVRLLSPYTMTIPLVGRAPELADLHTWRSLAKPILIRVLIGRAGSGKTRLALELCDRAVTQGWDAGFVTDSELERFFKQQNLSEWGWQHPTLIVIDYAAARSASIKASATLGSPRRTERCGRQVDRCQNHQLSALNTRILQLPQLYQTWFYSCLAAVGGSKTKVTGRRKRVS